MVVLELEGQNNMLGSGPNQYIQPDSMFFSGLGEPVRILINRDRIFLMIFFEILEHILKC